ncbi:hypothetical protein ACQQ2N_08105 [Dokdonella sp. MW10]|uniref:hypothetical protein n=1 Tax=Dokdonella sp. MW10 TaxID=2992926 RepID=UPI003F805AAF
MRDGSGRQGALVTGAHSPVPLGCTLRLRSTSVIEAYRFNDDGHVAATLGTVDGPVCAVVLAYRVSGDGALDLEGAGLHEAWRAIHVSRDEVSVERHGTRIVFAIERCAAPATAGDAA